VVYIRKLPSGKFQATVKHPSGRRHTKTDPLKRVVADWGADLEAKIRRGEYVDPSAGRITLGEWWLRWGAARTVERATLDKNASQWRNHVKPAFGTWPLTSITSWEVEAWVARMVRAAVGAETVASSLRLLSQLLDSAVRHRLVATNVAALVSAPAPPKHVDRFLSHEEADQLLAQLEDSDYLFVDLLLNTGLRFAEAAGLHAFRADLMRRQLTVVEVLRRDGSLKTYPKSQAGQRVVPLTDGLVVGLSKHLGDRPRNGLVFAGPGGGVLAYTNWRRRVWVPAVSAAKLAEPLPTPHDCRHTYGSWLAEEGVPPHEIAALMGHSTLRATERYVHASEARLERARKALGARRAHDHKEAGSP